MLRCCDSVTTTVRNGGIRGQQHTPRGKGLRVLAKGLRGLDKGLLGASQGGSAASVLGLYWRGPGLSLDRLLGEAPRTFDFADALSTIDQRNY